MSGAPGVPVVGLLLAAGAGRRMGAPKALLRDAAGRSLVARAVAVLLAGGCGRVVVVVGARADEVEELVMADPRVQTVRAADWSLGQGASLRVGLTALESSSEAAALVMLVDLPDVSPPVIARLLGHAGPTALARAIYGGRPGHPVLLGRAHWSGILTGIDPSEGARGYLAGHDPVGVPCDDLAGGLDVDHPADAAAYGFSWPGDP